MNAEDLASGPVVALEFDHSLSDVAREMEANRASAVVVKDRGVLVGIITERDLVRAAADDVAFENTLVEDYMTPAPVTIASGAGPAEAQELMLEGDFRHVPVLDPDGEVVGVLKLRDVVRALVSK